jgi:5-methylcytosine-specific restriction endonuclease McrA
MARGVAPPLAGKPTIGPPRALQRGPDSRVTKDHPRRRSHGSHRFPRLPHPGRRLGELAGDERRIQVEFLLHLEEFDRRRAFLELGHGSLWAFCITALHLREGAAGRRINAMRVLRRFPRLAGALRDGRLCLSTLALLGQVLTEENADELVDRAAFRTKEEVDHLVASLRPRQAPREGIRALPTAEPAGTAGEAGSSRDLSSEAPHEAKPASSDPVPELVGAPAAEAASPAVRPARQEMRAVSEEQWSLRVTVGRALKDDLETLAGLLSHTIRKGDLAAVLHEAVRCGIEKHGKRKGAVKPERKVKAKAPKSPTVVSAELRRQVWERDGGRCAWTSPEGKRCGSRWQLEVDHVDPVARGGKATIDRLRLLCKSHNLRYAEEVFGREHMKKYRKGEFTDPGGSGLPPPPVAREAQVGW